jgi:HAMP domain-containing protein
MMIERRFIWTFILVGFTLLLGSLAVGGILASNRASVVSTSAALERATSLRSILAVVRDFKSATLAYAITRRRPQELQAQKLHAELGKQLDAKEALAPDMVQAIRPMIAEYVKLMVIISDEMSSSNRNRGINLYTNDASKREQQIIELVEKAVLEAAQLAEDEVLRLQDTQKNLQITIFSVGSVIVALILGILVAARRMLKDFRRMVDVMQQVAAGADDTELPFQTRKDEIGHVPSTCSLSSSSG